MLRDLHLLQATPHTMCSGARGTPGQDLIPVTQLGSMSRQPRRMSCNVGAACALCERPTPGPWAPGRALSPRQAPPSQSWSWAVPPDNQGPGTTFWPESGEDAVRPLALEVTLSLWTRHSRHHTQLARSPQQDRWEGNAWELLHLG